MRSKPRLLRTWIEKTIAAIAEVAAPDAEGNLAAPIHLIFYDAYDQRVLMNALARHLGQVFGATSLYDFVSQLAAYTSPVLTVLADEVQRPAQFPAPLPVAAIACPLSQVSLG